MNFGDWVEKNNILVAIIFWGALILIYFLTSNSDVDYGERYEACNNLLGRERDVCENNIDLYLEQEQGNIDWRSF